MFRQRESELARFSHRKRNTDEHTRGGCVEAGGGARGWHSNSTALGSHPTWAGVMTPAGLTGPERERERDWFVGELRDSMKRERERGKGERLREGGRG